MKQLMKTIYMNKYTDYQKIGQAVLVLEGVQELHYYYEGGKGVITVEPNDTLKNVETDETEEIKSIGDMAYEAIFWDAINYIEIYDEPLELSQEELEAVRDYLDDGKSEYCIESLLDKIQDMIDQKETFK